MPDKHPEGDPVDEDELAQLVLEQLTDPRFAHEDVFTRLARLLVDGTED